MSENTNPTENINLNPIKRGRGRPKGSTKVSKAVLPVNKAQLINPSNEGAPQKKDRLNSLLRATGSKYDTLDVEVYSNRLDNMSLHDLYDEAMRVGLKPLADRSLTTRTLLELFHEDRRRFVNVNDASAIPSNLEQDKRNRLTQLMKDGR